MGRLRTIQIHFCRLGSAASTFTLVWPRVRLRGCLLHLQRNHRCGDWNGVSIQPVFDKMVPLNVAALVGVSPGQIAQADVSPFRYLLQAVYFACAGTLAALAVTAGGARLTDAARSNRLPVNLSAPKILVAGRLAGLALPFVLLAFIVCFGLPVSGHWFQTRARALLLHWSRTGMDYCTDCQTGRTQNCDRVAWAWRFDDAVCPRSISKLGDGPRLHLCNDGAWFEHRSWLRGLAGLGLCGLFRHRRIHLCLSFSTFFFALHFQLAPSSEHFTESHFSVIRMALPVRVTACNRRILLNSSPASAGAISRSLRWLCEKSALHVEHG